MSKDKIIWNVLVFPGGTENAIEIYTSLKNCKEVKLFSASSDVQNHAPYIYKENHFVADINSPHWIDQLNSIIEKNSIDLIFPANSIIIDHLSMFRDKIKTDILLPDNKILELTRSKKKTYRHLKETTIIPRIYNKGDEVTNFPVFVKPDRGYGAQGARMINSHNELKNIDFDKYVVQEFLPGKEYTVDCFTDKNGELLFSGGRERSRIRMATSMHADILDDNLQSDFKKIAKNILNNIKITGSWFYQLKLDKYNDYKLLEIDLRIAGTMGFNRCRGVNFSLLAIYQHFKQDVSILTNDIKISLDRCLRNRYILDHIFDTVYIDLDDTIIVHGKINLDVITFLYQCVNKNIQIILISKSLRKNKEAFLKKWKINQLFDEKIWLKESENKYNFIKHEKSIYIDDSYSQRLGVAMNVHIPTFDTSMIEVLIDDRI